MSGSAVISLSTWLSASQADLRRRGLSTCHEAHRQLPLGVQRAELPESSACSWIWLTNAVKRAVTAPTSPARNSTSPMPLSISRCRSPRGYGPDLSPWPPPPATSCAIRNVRDSAKNKNLAANSVGSAAPVSSPCSNARSHAFQQIRQLKQRQRPHRRRMARSSSL